MSSTVSTIPLDAPTINGAFISPKSVTVIVEYEDTEHVVKFGSPTGGRIELRTEWPDAEIRQSNGFPPRVEHVATVVLPQIAEFAASVGVPAPVIDPDHMPASGRELVVWTPSGV
jgi:hypothetical protein